MAFNFTTASLSTPVSFVDLEPFQVIGAREFNGQIGYVDLDKDLVDDGVERSAPKRRRQSDGVRDDQQNNVTSLPHPVSGNFVTLAAPNGQKLNNVNIVTPFATPPRDIDFRIGLLQYELTSVPANSGATTITIFVENTTGFNSYYKYVRLLTILCPITIAFFTMVTRVRRSCPTGLLCI